MALEPTVTSKVATTDAQINVEGSAQRESLLASIKSSVHKVAVFFHRVVSVIALPSIMLIVTAERVARSVLSWFTSLAAWRVAVVEKITAFLGTNSERQETQPFIEQPTFSAQLKPAQNTKPLAVWQKGCGIAMASTSNNCCIASSMMAFSQQGFMDALISQLANTEPFTKTFYNLVHFLRSHDVSNDWYQYNDGSKLDQLRTILNLENGRKGVMLSISQIMDAIVSLMPQVHANTSTAINYIVLSDANIKISESVKPCSVRPSPTITSPDQSLASKTLAKFSWAFRTQQAPYERKHTVRHSDMSYDVYTESFNGTGQITSNELARYASNNSLISSCLESYSFHNNKPWMRSSEHKEAVNNDFHITYTCTTGFSSEDPDKGAQRVETFRPAHSLHESITEFYKQNSQIHFSAPNYLVVAPANYGTNNKVRLNTEEGFKAQVNGQTVHYDLISEVLHSNYHYTARAHLKDGSTLTADSLGATISKGNSRGSRKVPALFILKRRDTLHAALPYKPAHKHTLSTIAEKVAPESDESEEQFFDCLSELLPIPPETA